MREIITRITEITGSIATLHATGVGLGELAEIQSPGRKTLGQVIRVSGDMVTLQVFGGTKGLATDDQGNLYVYSSVFRDEGSSSQNLQVFDREGKYLRTIMPMPANLPKEKILPFTKTNAHGDKAGLNPPGKYFYPRNYSGVWPMFYPDRMGYLAPRVGSLARLRTRR